NANLTREQMAKAMAIYIDVSGVKMPRETTAPSAFSDEKKVAAWAREYVEVLRRAGIVNGDAEGRYNPKKNITRAEAATIILNLIEAGEKAWQGYEPDLDRDGYALYGARYLWYNTLTSQGELGTELVTDFDHPALSVYEDILAADNSNCDTPGTTGISLTAINVKASDAPFVRVCYKYGDGGEHTLSCLMAFIAAKVGTVPLTVTDGGEEDGWKVAYIDLGQVSSDARAETNICQLLLKPFADGEENTGFFVKYFALFRNGSDRDAFTAAEYTDYFDNYRLYSNADVTELTPEAEAEYERKIADRIGEIMTSESELTPAMIEKRGGTCYYISSIHGNDANDGLSPETAWKSPSMLQKRLDNGVIRKEMAKPGDGVFFERGSIFYPEIYTQYSKATLLVNTGVAYGAYGKGEKPVLSMALDLGGGNGRWLPTEWENVWELDPEQIDEKPEYRTEKCDIGNIIFNDGEYIGIRITPEADYRNSADVTSSDYVPFGEGRYSLNVGLVSNGMEWFEVGERELTDIGAALRNNLEFVHDRKNGKLYLYWDGGKDGIKNPADAFDDIKISRNGTAVISTVTGRDFYGNFSDFLMDNVSMKFATDYLCRIEGHDITFTNCEIGWSNKGLSLVASGIEIYGNAENWTIKNCYFHEVGDGPMSSQGGNGTHSENLEWTDNVVVCCGCGAEIWQCDEGSYLKDISLKNNIFAYIGAGLIQSGNYGYLTGGHVINGFMTGTKRTENIVMEQNLIYKPVGQILPTYLITDAQDKVGWLVRDNEYVGSEKCASIVQNHDDLPYRQGVITPNACLDMPFNERVIGYLTTLGIDPTGKYVTYDDGDAEKATEKYFTFRFITSWYAEHPETKPIKHPAFK
ncbi:MAG: S-layer homology domain-containing protein, partial [Clostridia bacterium]|nr:S-layer homology domain-containing protein [Clostridia bacterium]